VTIIASLLAAPKTPDVTPTLAELREELSREQRLPAG
jgi:hypothetical protein